jgi:tetratricopeptide (TPR) repeat protein
MKILLVYGRGDNLGFYGEQIDLWKALGDDVRVFSYSHGDLAYTPGMEFEKILEKLNFKPDVVLLHSPEFWPLPKNIEAFDGIVAAMIGDWHCNTLAVLASQYAIDYNFTDKRGVEVLKKWNLQADYFPMFCSQPSISPLPDFMPIYDLIFIGNFEPWIWPERHRLLYRLAKLSMRFRIGFFSNIWGKEYNQILNMAKIVFNRSVHGSMNARTFEALASGSLLFIEEENLEARDFLEDRVHAVFYNEKNLEELVDYYLSHDEERKRISRLGNEKMRSFSFPARVKEFLKKLHELPKDKRYRKSIFNLKNPTTFQWQTIVPDGFSPLSSLFFDEPLQLNNQVAFELSCLAYSTKPEKYKEIGWPVAYLPFNNGEGFILDSVRKKLKKLKKFAVDNPIICFNLGFHAHACQKMQKAEMWFSQAVRLLENGCPVVPHFLPVLFPFSDFCLRWQTMFREPFSTHAGLPKEVLLQESYRLLADSAERRGNAKSAEAFFRRGLALDENNPKLLRGLAKLLVREGRHGEARPFLAKAFELQPLWFDLAKELLDLLRIVDEKAALEFFKEYLVVLGAFPSLRRVRKQLMSQKAPDLSLLVGKNKPQPNQSPKGDVPHFEVSTVWRFAKAFRQRVLKKIQIFPLTPLNKHD